MNQKYLRFDLSSVKITGFSYLIQLIVSFKIPSRIYFASHWLKNLLFFGDTDWTTISNIFCTRIIWNRNGLINAVLQKIWHPIIFPNMTNRRHIRIPLYEQKYFNHYTGTGSGKWNCNEKFRITHHICTHSPTEKCACISCKDWGLGWTWNCNREMRI